MPEPIKAWLRKALAVLVAFCACLLVPLIAYRILNPRRDYNQAGFTVGGGPVASDRAFRRQAGEASPAAVRGAAAPQEAMQLAPEPAPRGDGAPGNAPSGSYQAAAGQAPNGGAPPTAAGQPPVWGAPAVQAAPQGSGFSQFKQGMVAAVRGILAGGASPAPTFSSPPAALGMGASSGASSAGMPAGPGNAVSEIQSRQGPSLGGSSGVSDPGVRTPSGGGVNAGKGVDKGSPVQDAGSSVPGGAPSSQELAQTLAKNLQKSLDMLNFAANQAAISQAAAAKGGASAAKGGPAGVPNPSVDSKSIELNGGKVSATALVGEGKPIKDSNGIIGFSYGGNKVWEQDDMATFTGSDVPFGGAARIFCGGDPNNPLSYGRLAEMNGGTGVGYDQTLYANGSPSGCSAAGF